MAVAAAQRLAAATAWFPPAALAFDLTAAVAFAGAVTAQAILAVRSKKEMNYIASMSATIGASSALQPATQCVQRCRVQPHWFNE